MSVLDQSAIAKSNLGLRFEWWAVFWPLYFEPYLVLWCISLYYKIIFHKFSFFFFRVVFIFHTASKQFNENILKTMDVEYNFHFSLTLIALMISRFNGGFTLHVAVVALARIWTHNSCCWPMQLLIFTTNTRAWAN